MTEPVVKTLLETEDPPPLSGRWGHNVQRGSGDPLCDHCTGHRPKADHRLVSGEWVCAGHARAWYGQLVAFGAQQFRDTDWEVEELAARQRLLALRRAVA